jgi:hypothetical protein
MNPRTMRIISVAVVTALAGTVLIIGISYDWPVDYAPVIDPEDFVSIVDNEFFPLTPGTAYIYEGNSSEGPEYNEVRVTYDTKVVLGVTCIVVRDSVWTNGELAEVTYDWYAQDTAGNVWYFGEDSQEYSNGLFVSGEGSWEAGIDGAYPGIIMEAAPAPGDSYRQEYYKGEAEDRAEVLALNVTADVPYGSFADCLKTKEWTALEKGVVENKYYAPGIGVVLEEMVKGGTDRMELVQMILPP